jgi:hypothetical protein
MLLLSWLAVVSYVKGVTKQLLQANTSLAEVTLQERGWCDNCRLGLGLSTALVTPTVASARHAAVACCSGAAAVLLQQPVKPGF